jgi:tetratricopeptide (TPR) repeat protein
MKRLMRIDRIIACFILVLQLKMSCFSSVPDSLSNSSIEYEYAIEEAIKQFNFGNYSQSLYLFQKCLEVNNRSVAAYYQVSNIYLLAGDSKNALNYARSAYVVDNSNKWVCLLLVKCYQMVDRNDSAILVIEHLLVRNKENLDLKYEYGNLLSGSGRLNEAIACFNEIDQKIGLNEGTALARHQIYLQKHDFKAAVKELDDLIKIFPEEIRYMGMEAELYSSVHNTSKAKEIYKKILEIDSSNNLALISITDFYRDIKEYGNAFYYLKKVIGKADIQLDAKVGLLIGYIRNDSDLLYNREIIRNNIDKLLIDSPGNIKIEKLLVDYYIRTNNYDSAIHVIDRFIAEEQSQDIWEQYFLLLNARGKYEKIVQKYNEAKEHAGETSEIYIIAGIANIQLLKYSDAIAILSDGLKIKNLKDADKVEILKYLGEAGYKLKEFKVSDSCFDEVLKIDPLDYLVLNNYSFYLALRDTELLKARNMSYKVIKKFPTNSTYIDTYGFVLMKLHKYNAALKYMKRAVSLNANEDPDIYEHMGDVLFFKGKKEEALIYWNKAKEKGSKDIDLTNKLNSLKNEN